jgi:hypothetical protein
MSSQTEIISQISGKVWIAEALPQIPHKHSGTFKMACPNFWTEDREANPIPGK